MHEPATSDNDTPISVTRHHLLRGQHLPAHGKEDTLTPYTVMVPDILNVAQQLNAFASMNNLAPEHRAIFREAVRRELSVDFIGTPSSPYIVDIQAIPTDARSLNQAIQVVIHGMNEALQQRHDDVRNHTVPEEIRNDICSEDRMFTKYTSKFLSSLLDQSTTQAHTRLQHWNPSRFRVTPVKVPELSLASLQYVSETWRGFQQSLADHPKFRTILGAALENELGLQFTESQQTLPPDSLQEVLDEERVSISIPKETLKGQEGCAHITHLERIPTTQEALNDKLRDMYIVVKQRIAKRLDELDQAALPESERERLITENKQFAGDVKILCEGLQQKVAQMQIVPGARGAAR